MFSGRRWRALLSAIWYLFLFPAKRWFCLTPLLWNWTSLKFVAPVLPIFDEIMSVGLQSNTGLSCCKVRFESGIFAPFGKTVYCRPVAHLSIWTAPKSLPTTLNPSEPPLSSSFQPVLPVEEMGLWVALWYKRWQYSYIFLRRVCRLGWA